MTTSLGERYRDQISGFEGIATARTEKAYSSATVFLEPTELRDGPANRRRVVR
jgi:hypothetical protein